MDIHESPVEFVPVGSPLVDKVAALAAEIWRQHYTPIIGEAQVAYMLDRYQSPTAIARQLAGGFRYFLIRDRAGHYVGYCAVEIKAGELFLSKLYVDALFRGKGYGKKALAFVERIARQERVQSITLTVNKNNSDSIAVYKKCGFGIEGSVVQDIGGGFVMDDYRMKKEL
jgi:ribosomal protein S18 acetylase RimI-like enzyme